MMFHFILKKKTILLGVMLMGLGMNTACTDEEVALGTGVAIGVIGGIAISDRHDGRRERCYNRRACHEYRDYYGRWRRDCRTERVCRRTRHYNTYSQFGVLSDDVQLTSQSKAEISSVALASKFGMSYTSADKLIFALEQSAYHKNHQPVSQLGLSGDDARRLAWGRLPTESGIKKLAKTLNQNPYDTKAMLKTVVDEMN